MAHRRILILLLTWTTYYHAVTSCNLLLSPFEKATKLPTFVDKTELLKTFFSAKFVLITCPSGFGKSSNVDMVKRFSENTRDETNKELFKNPQLQLQVAKDNEFFELHFSKYSVLYLNFSVENYKTTHKEISGVIYEQIWQLFENYDWLYQPVSPDPNRVYPNQYHKNVFTNMQAGNKADSESLKILSEDLVTYWNGERGTILLIDDYDEPIIKAMECGANAEDIIKIIHTLLSNALSLNNDNNIKINYVFIVGTHMYSEFSDNITHFGFLGVHTFFPHFGFTFKNMKKLHDTYSNGINIPTGDSKIQWNNIRRFYNGYFSPSSEPNDEDSLLFNPTSVNQYYKENKFQSYRPQTRYPNIPLEELLKSEFLREKVAKFILFSESVFKREVVLSSTSVKILEEALNRKDPQANLKQTDVSILLSTLFDQGYFSYTSGNYQLEESRTFRLPNEEVRLQLTSDVFKYFQKVIPDCTNESRIIFKLLQSILESNLMNEEQILTKLCTVMEVLKMPSKPNADHLLILDFRLFIYTSLIYGGEPAERYNNDSIALRTTVDRANRNRGNRYCCVDLSIWSKDESVLLYVKIETNLKYATLQDAIDYARNFRPSAQLVKKPKYLRILLIYQNRNNKLEVGLCPTAEYSNGVWIISTPETSMTSPNTFFQHTPSLTPIFKKHPNEVVPSISDNRMVNYWMYEILQEENRGLIRDNAALEISLKFYMGVSGAVIIRDGLDKFKINHLGKYCPEGKINKAKMKTAYTKFFADKSNSEAMKLKNRVEKDYEIATFIENILEAYDKSINLIHGACDAFLTMHGIDDLSSVIPNIPKFKEDEKKCVEILSYIFTKPGKKVDEDQDHQ